MISYKQIKGAINAQLKNRFNVEINSQDIKEGFSRPSFFVEFDDLKRQTLETQIERSFTVRIYYFAKNKNAPSMENLDVLEELENLFDAKLQVADRHFNIFETDSLESDGVLQFEFSISYEDARESRTDENGNLMMQLNYKNEVQ